MMLAFKIGFLELTWVDALDILLVAFLFFRLYKLLKGGVGLPIFIGMLAFYLLFLVVKTVKMEMLTLIMGQIMGVGAVAIIIVFQQEIRRFLIVLGKSTYHNKKLLQILPWKHHEEFTDIIDLTPITEVAKFFSATKTGALIVFEREDGLNPQIESGDMLDAHISKRLLMAIFNKESPLHDGAVIIKKDRIEAARCILPVTQKDDLPASMGLRHRAAYGLSEETDAVILVVSEETGHISVVCNEVVHDNLITSELRGLLRRYLSEEDLM